MSSRGIPEVLMKKVDEYVDSLAPQVQPRITSELEDFQAKTIDSLETQVVDAFRSLFNKDSRDSGASRGLRSDSAPDAYGGQSLPFANEISKLTRSFTDLADGASGDLRDILKLTEGSDGPGETRSRGGGGSDSSRGMKGFLSTAVNVVQDRLDSKATGPGGQKFELEGLLGILSNTVQDAARNPEEKARLISPDIKERVGAKLREQHAPIAEQFTRIALDHIKRWLRGNVSTRDLGDGAKGEIEDQVKGLIKGVGSLFKDVKKQGDGSSRGVGDGDRDRDDGESSGGFSKLISNKLSTGLGKVHREVRLEFRKVLGGLEKQLFELLPDEFQRPLEKILGGNPFDSQLDRDASSRGDRGFGDDIKAKLVGKLRDLVRKVQETLRESILGVVSGGHRKFEKHSWVFVQNIVEGKVQKYLPKVKITVPDDIGDEGVDVGAPSASTQLGGGSKPASPLQGGRVSPPPQEQHGRPPYAQDQQHQDSRPDYQQQQSQQGYRPDHQQTESQQDYRPGHHQQHQSQQDDYRPGLQQHQSQKDDYRPGYQQHQPQDYRPGHQQDQSQDYRPNNYQQSQSQQDDYRPGHQQHQSQKDDYRPGHQQHQSQDYRPDNYQQSQEDYRPDSYKQGQPQQAYRPDSYQQGQSQQDYRPDPYQRHESNQDHRPGQYQSEPQGHPRQDRFDQPQSYQQDQSYRQEHRQDSRQDYRQDQGDYRQESRKDYRQDQGGYRQNEGHQQDQGYRQDYRQDQGGYQQDERYEQGQRYGQNSRY